MRYTFDLEPEEDPFHGLALILFHTSAPNYTFVDDLNHLYRLRLARREDMELDSDHYPLYSYRDPMRHLTYHLIERPAQLSASHSPLTTLWSPLQKLLFIQGEYATEADDLAAATRHNILAAFHTAFTPVTALDPSAPLPPDASRKAQRQHTEMKQLVTSILQYFDLHYEG